MKVVMEKIAKLFPTYLMNPTNCKIFTLETFVGYGMRSHLEKEDTGSQSKTQGEK